MTDAETHALVLLQKLLVLARRWSGGLPVELGDAAHLRSRVLTLNHRRQMRRIPIYAQLAREMELDENDPFERFRDQMVLPDDWFKGYGPEWIPRDFASLTAWLQTISTVRVPTLALSATDLQSWRAELLPHVSVTISSGTSTGQPSLIPRDEVTLAALRSSSGVRFPWSLSSGDYDCLLFTPKGMGSGIQSGAAGLAMNARHVHHFQSPGVIQFLREAAKQHQKVVLYGPPSGLCTLIEELAQVQGNLELPKGSCVVTGGGWKRDGSQDIFILLDTASGLLGIDRQRCVDAYSTAELNTVFVSCANNRYHVPPVVEAVIVDDLLRPVDEIDGALAVFDPFARSYPSLLATSDRVKLGIDPCPCGLAGQTLVPPIARLTGAAARGCGVNESDTE